ncbi:Zn-dependent hydrolase [Candidatus Saccharibacteria bacterium]|nr:MAG: Zn-dependent hydrolase [Candidatus Saccharibacteria bacterium]PID98868.1 MAG: Zn-dependent hydrolase [Candidatus Saccharibacteria bacterium]
MDIQFYGANCVVITTKQVRIVCDDTLASLGAKSVTREGDVCLFTAAHPDAVAGAKMTIDMAGEYETSGINIRGMQARAHVDTEQERTATMYKLTIGDTRVLVAGHIYPKLSESKLEEIGLVDVLVVPVGGNGYTLDPEGALRVVKAIEPKVFIPTHYADSALKYEVPQQPLQDALKVFGMEPKETTAKFQLKPSDAADTTQLVVLEKS